MRRIQGRVIEGSRLGRTWGFPTANIAVDHPFPYENGVYAACAWINGRSRCYDAMVNLGVKPTFFGWDQNNQRFLEVHLFDFEGNLYGRELRVDLHRFIRPERKFDSPEELRAQIEKDKAEVEKYFKTPKPLP